jgi:hypothetical protein
MRQLTTLLVACFFSASAVSPAIAQLRPEQRPAPIPKRKPAPAATAPETVTVDALGSPPPDKSRKKVKYVPPVGFGGHKWGDLRSSFQRLPSQPLGVGAAFGRPVEKSTSFICRELNSPGSAASGCDFYTMIMTMSKTYEGGGFYVLSEYSIDDQGFRFNVAGGSVLLHPVIYQFCANWDDTKKVVPEDFDSLNQFCGVRSMFRSETPEELRKLPGDHVTNYDRVLELLLSRYGKPDGFLQRGRVVIETLEGESSDAGDRKFHVLRWCPARDRSLHTSCTASVVLTFEPARGIGTVLYATPLLWQYAHARHNGGFKDDKLFRMLHARD